jgi:hypothetical protein
VLASGGHGGRGRFRSRGQGRRGRGPAACPAQPRHPEARPPASDSHGSRAVAAALPFAPAGVADIDGAGKVLGRAGPLRTRGDGTELPISGMMEFDAADVSAAPDAAFWGGVIMHESEPAAAPWAGAAPGWHELGCLRAV